MLLYFSELWCSILDSCGKACTSSMLLFGISRGKWLAIDYTLHPCHYRGAHGGTPVFVVRNSYIGAEILTQAPLRA